MGSITEQNARKKTINVAEQFKHVKLINHRFVTRDRRGNETYLNYLLKLSTHMDD